VPCDFFGAHIYLSHVYLSLSCAHTFFFRRRHLPLPISFAHIPAPNSPRPVELPCPSFVAFLELTSYPNPRPFPLVRSYAGHTSASCMHIESFPSRLISTRLVTLSLPSFLAYLVCAPTSARIFFDAYRFRRAYIHHLGHLSLIRTRLTRTTNCPGLPRIGILIFEWILEALIRIATTKRFPHLVIHALHCLLVGLLFSSV
jgi:hypothetical protein